MTSIMMWQRQREKLVRHDVMSHVYAYGVSSARKQQASSILGATSCYVGDNTDLIIMTEASAARSQESW